MGVSAYRSTTVHLVRCSKCHRPTHITYRKTIGNFSYIFCSGKCMNEAEHNYEYKIKNGISPDNLTPIVEEQDESEFYD